MCSRTAAEQSEYFCLFPRKKISGDGRIGTLIFYYGVTVDFDEWLTPGYLTPPTAYAMGFLEAFSVKQGSLTLFLRKKRKKRAKISKFPTAKMSKNPYIIRLLSVFNRVARF